MSMGDLGSGPGGITVLNPRPAPQEGTDAPPAAAASDRVGAETREPNQPQPQIAEGEFKDIINRQRHLNHS